MDENFSIEDVITWASEIFPVEVDAETGNVRVVVESRHDSEGEAIDIYTTIERTEDIEHALARLSHKTIENQTALIDQRSYEVLVESNSPGLAWRRMAYSEDPFAYKDAHSGVAFSVGPPSDEYLLFLMHQATSLRTVRYSRRKQPWSMQDLGLTGLESSLGIQYGLLDYIRRGVRPLATLVVTSQDRKSPEEFESLAESMLFQLAYNIDEPIAPQRNLEEVLLVPSRIASIRRARPPEMEAPKRQYIGDLVHHYLLAVRSNSPALEYLSYYHIAEHFFEKAFNDELIKNVRNIITQPDFYYGRDNDIKKVIKKVKDSFRNQGERVTFSELEALRLTLARYVTDWEAIAEQLRSYDPKLIDHYRDEVVSFSNGDKVDLEDQNNEKLIRDLAARVYKTRNAIVHSKEGDRGRYAPFKNDRELAQETPLMRFVAEQIIINSAGPL